MDKIYLVYYTTDVEMEDGLFICRDWEDGGCSWYVDRAFTNEETAKEYIAKYKEAYNNYISNFKIQFGFSLTKFYQMPDEEYEQLKNKEEILDWLNENELQAKGFNIHEVKCNNLTIN